jgi:hypothetical protein
MAARFHELANSVPADFHGPEMTRPSEHVAQQQQQVQSEKEDE